MNNKIRIITIVLFAVFLFISCGGGGENKKIKIAYANWSEGIAMTYMVRTILQEQGYDVELLNADLADIYFTFPEKGRCLYGCLVAGDDE